MYCVIHEIPVQSAINMAKNSDRVDTQRESQLKGASKQTAIFQPSGNPSAIILVTAFGPYGMMNVKSPTKLSLRCAYGLRSHLYRRAEDRCVTEIINTKDSIKVRNFQEWARDRN